ncbi:hypothetical protein LCGC14_0850490 [marine sediment metagenome]|uniref:HNH nuclease domain-containing protein n=1 Tax=marine sediment metagenome TaxID=412755 RepID=A0A0F9PAH8_9ZZZZ
MDTKPKCKTCGKPIKKAGRRTYCASCVVASSRRRTRLRAIKARGGACVVCGYDRSYWALAFHHIDPATKSFHISGNTRAWTKVKSEIQKCTLVCHNCHSEIHAGMVQLSAFDAATGKIKADVADATLPDDLEALGRICTAQTRASRRKGLSGRVSKARRSKAPRYDKICALETCAASFVTKRVGALYCSSECAHKNTRRTKRPSKEKLHRLVWKYPTSYIAKRLGVSDNAVGKWCRQYEIDKPPRGYWAKQRAAVERPRQDELQMLVWQLPIVHIADHFGVAESTVRGWCRDYDIDTPESGYWSGREYSTTV